MSGRAPRTHSQGRGQGSDQPSGRGRGRGDRGDRGRGDRGRGDRGRGDRGSGRGDRGQSFTRDGGDAGFRGGRGRGAPLEVFQGRGGSIPTPDSGVAQLESSLGPRSRQEVPDLSTLSLSERLPARPGYGTRGTPILLWANYFKLMPQPDSKVHRYHLDVSPDVTGRQRHRVIQLLLSESSFSNIAHKIASDFQSTLLCASQLSSEQTDTAVKYREPEDTAEAGDGTLQGTSKHYRVKLTKTGSLAVGDLINYLSGTSATDAFTDQHEITQALNIILGHHPKAKPTNTRVSTKSNVHFVLDSLNVQSYDLTGGLQAWRGYFISVRAATGRLLVNVQVKHGAMYKRCRLDQLIQEFLKDNSDKRDLQRFLTKVRIGRLHLKPKSKPTVIDGLASTTDGRDLQHPPRIKHFAADARNIEFFLGESPPKPKSGKPLPSNQYISVHQFFLKVYGIDSKPNIPAVKIGSQSNPSYLPPEACEVLPAQIARAKLTPSQTAQMIRFAVRRPHENARSIVETGLADVGLGTSNPVLDAFGLAVETQMVTVQGRILNAPTLQFARNQKTQTKFGGWNLGSLAFPKGQSLAQWSVLWLKDPNSSDPWRNDPGALTGSLREFHQILNSSGMTASPPLLPGVDIRVGTGNDRLAIEDGFKRMREKGRGEKLLLVLLPYRSDSLYQSVKQLADMVFGIHTVCSVASKFAKDRNQQYFANEALKFNLKLGGANQSLSSQNLGFIDTGKTMVVGIDVTHPSPGSVKTAPSVAAMVASIDKSVSQFPGTVSVQEGRKEMVTDLSTMLKSRLQLWRKHNQNILPENILVYRDGVSEGQYDIVVNDELPLLQEACRETYPPKGKKPAISIIIAGKRHNTRFYPTTTNRIDERSGNTPNGTVVDRGITQSRYWDFFLQAHTAIQGTARPAHYFVVHDEIFANMRPPPGFQHAGDVLEDVTHNLCYMFGRATKAVSLCPPAYYADLLCERTRIYLSHLFSPEASQAGSVTGGSDDTAPGGVKIHDNLKDTMFYI